MKETRTRTEYDVSLTKSHQFCASKLAVGFSKKEESLYCWRFPVCCDRWECPRCGKIKRRRLRRKVKQNWGNTRMRFITLTCNASNLTPDAAAAEISHAWELFSKRLRRRYPNLKYFKALEWHQNSRPHLHILVNTYIPQAYISDIWQQLFSSPRVWIEQIGTAKGINYVTKYTTKWISENRDESYLYFRYKLRRYSFSRNFLVSNPADTKRLFYIGTHDITAEEIYNRLVREFIATYYFSGASPDGTLFLFDLSRPPDPVFSNDP